VSEKHTLFLFPPNWKQKYRQIRNKNTAKLETKTPPNWKQKYIFIWLCENNAIPLPL
jgi:hypothetical protein